MIFNKYQHIERFGTDEVAGIENGECYVFPKIDGTNGSVWLGDDGLVHAASRRRELSAEDDNHGFCKMIVCDENIRRYLIDHPDRRLYGEYLIPHSLKTYRDNAWRKFYVFDVYRQLDAEGEIERAMPYPEYSKELKEYGIEYIPPICIINNGDLESFLAVTEKNFYLIKDNSGVGEGIVIKNYSFYNKYGRQTWAKIVTNEFKDKHKKEMPTNVVDVHHIEMDIAEKYITRSLVEKEHAKIMNECDGWNSKMIPRLLNQVYHCLIEEEMWNILKEFKSPTIDFKQLNRFSILRIKSVCPELF